MESRAQRVDLEKAQMVLFFFPRDPEITPADKEVAFVLEFNRFKVRRKFKLKSLVYEGKLAV